MLNQSKRRIGIMGGFLVLFFLSSFGQQDVQFTQYMYNTLAVNPAYAGSKGMLNVSTLHRQQWIGIKGAPTTQTFFIHSPVFSESTGLGFSFVNDNAGPVHQMSFMTDYSYKIKISENAKLAFGLKGSINRIESDINNLKTTDPNDLSFIYANTITTAPNFGFGLYYYTPSFYLGVSTPKLLETQIENIAVDKITRLVRHYYFIGGAIFPVTETIKLKPAFMVKATPNAPLSVDVSLEAYYRDKISIGIMNRFGDSFGFLLGYQLTDQIRAGIAFDHTTSSLTKFNNGTFELFLSYDFIYKSEKTVSPRYF